MKKKPYDFTELRNLTASLTSYGPYTHRRGIGQNGYLMLETAGVEWRTRSLMNNGQIAVAPVDVRELISETAALVEPSIKLKSQQFSMDIPPDLPNVLMDRELTEQAILNLVNNASKYTPEAGKISVRAFRHRSNVTVEVSDTGPGIPEKEFPFLFEEFYRGERADTKGAPGDGLGLAIARQAVEQQGGTIAVRSMLGQGTTFSVTLPCD